jgi:DNA-binding response OmpR family regulator
MTGRFLLVEDDRHIALALEIRLKAEGFDVAVVGGAREAVRVASEQIPDIALIDYNLPDGSGFELMRCFAEEVSTSCIRSIS